MNHFKINYVDTEVHRNTIINCSYNVKNNFYEIFITCYAQIGPKINSTQNLLKFSTFDVSNIPVWILMSKFFSLNTYHLFGPKWSQN